LTIIGLVATGCRGTDTKKFNETLEEAKIVNMESHLGLEYLLLSELTDEQASNYNTDQPESAGTDDGYIKGYYFRYPDKYGERRLTQIRIKNGDYHVFGIKLGDEMDSASEVLKQRGYKETKPSTIEKGANTKAFKKHSVIIQLETEPGSQTINEIALLTDTY